MSLLKLFWKKFGITGNNCCGVLVSECWHKLKPHTPSVVCVAQWHRCVQTVQTVQCVCQGGQVHCTAQVWHMSVYRVHCWSTMYWYNKNSDIQLLSIRFWQRRLNLFFIPINMRINLKILIFKHFNSDFKLFKQTNLFSQFWLQIMWGIHQLPTSWMKNLDLISQECKNYNGGW